MSDKPELAGQTAVVIGGSSGIGLEMARRARAAYFGRAYHDKEISYDSYH